VIVCFGKMYPNGGTQRKRKRRGKEKIVSAEIQRESIGLQGHHYTVLCCILSSYSSIILYLYFYFIFLKAYSLNFTVSAPLYLCLYCNSFLDIDLQNDLWLPKGCFWIDLISVIGEVCAFVYRFKIVFIVVRKWWIVC